LLTAGRAGAAAAQRAGIAGVADRALGPPRGRRPVQTAAGADAHGPRRARLADRAAAAGEVARPPAAAGGAEGLRHPIAVHAYVCAPAAAPDRDRSGLAARPARPVPALVTAAPLADRLAGRGAAGNRLDPAAAAAGDREQPAPAAGTYPAPARAGQRPPGRSAGLAGRRRELGRSTGDQLGDQ